MKKSYLRTSESCEHREFVQVTTLACRAAEALDGYLFWTRGSGKPALDKQKLPNKVRAIIFHRCSFSEHCEEQIITCG